MGCEVPIIKAADVGDMYALRQQGQLLRAEFLDAFARLEAAVMLYIQRTKVKATPAMPFSQKLGALSSGREQFRNPKRLDIRIAAIRKLLPVRADVVHSVLEVTTRFDGETLTTGLQFQNASDSARHPLLLSFNELERMTRRLDQLAEQFTHQRLKEAAPAAPAAASG